MTMPPSCGSRAALPRTRGFTEDLLLLAVIHGGSSAHARVHRATGPRSRRSFRLFRARAGSPSPKSSDQVGRCWLFRARAGSPLENGSMLNALEALPRTRGFTGKAAGERHGGGSSAHARVHSEHTASRSAARRFFRACAGSPGCRGQEPVQTGHPAHARVHPPTTTCSARRSKFFRACAGSPMGCLMVISATSVLPRTRGLPPRVHISDGNR